MTKEKVQNRPSDSKDDTVNPELEQLKKKKEEQKLQTKQMQIHLKMMQKIKKEYHHAKKKNSFKATEQTPEQIVNAQLLKYNTFQDNVTKHGRAQ